MTEQSNPESSHFSVEETTRNEKSLEFLVDPVDPMIFDPQPGGTDMPDPGPSTSQGGNDQPPETTAE